MPIKRSERTRVKAEALRVTRRWRAAPAKRYGAERSLCLELAADRTVSFELPLRRRQ